MSSVYYWGTRVGSEAPDKAHRFTEHRSLISLIQEDGENDEWSDHSSVGESAGGLLMDEQYSAAGEEGRLPQFSGKNEEATS